MASNNNKRHFMKYIKVLLVFVLVAIVAVSVLATGSGKSSWWRLPQQATETTVKTQPDRSQDAAILRELMAVSQQLDSVQSFYMQGNVVAKDPRDSTNTMNAAFTYHMDGSSMYCRLGDQEMLSLADRYMAVNHSIRKVFVAGPKVLNMPYKMSADSLRRMVQEDGYEITRTEVGDDVVIRLLRETHISCKEYTVTYEATTLNMKRVFMRLTDLEDPANPEKDKTVTVRFDRWVAGPVKDKMPGSNAWIRKESGHLTAAGQLTGYEVIRMDNMN